ncbi:MAG TPA: DUF1015 domain-containing protein [Desulfonatronum sp.]|nr:DUF1015 domain-containing protein [Desulfonatronum sp.]
MAGETPNLHLSFFPNNIMPDFIPLSFASYDWQRPDINPEQVCAPPYDVLSPEQRAQLAAGNPYNLVHVDLPTSYAHAGHILTQWRAQRVLKKADHPLFAALASRYTLDGREYLRWGFMGGLGLADWGQDGVYPHEQTYPKAKTDRLELMRATSAQLSPIFGVFDFAGGELQAVCDELAQHPPLVLLPVDGVEHRLWVVTARHAGLITKILRNVNVYIADGHHRYETALSYAQEQGRPGPWDHVFACLCNISSPGLKILPYHRLVTSPAPHPWPNILQRAAQWFTIREVESIDTLQQDDTPSSCLLQLPGVLRLLTLKNTHIGQCDPLFRDIGAYILDTFFFRQAMGLTDTDLAGGEHLAYTPFEDHAAEKVNQGLAQAALLLKPVNMAILRRVSESGRLMPRKSTFFHPKIPGGLLFHLLD